MDQVAYAVADVVVAATQWAATFGAGPFFVRHHPPIPTSTGTDFRHASAYGQWGPLQVELVAIEGGPTAGLHHIGRIVPSLDDEVRQLAVRGWPLLFEARTGSGVRFAFVDARSTLGHLVELYEPVPALLDLYAGVAMAASGWDGSVPVRPMEALPVRR